MLKVMRSLPIAGFLIGATLGVAQGQETRGANACDATIRIADNREEEDGIYPINICGASGLARQFDIYVPQVVQRAVRQSFGFGPSSIQPAGLSGLVAGEADERLSHSSIVIAPAADVSAAAPAAAPRWNTWVDGRYLWSDYAASAGDLDGATWSGLGGIDYKLNDKITLGVLVSGDRSDLRSGVADLESGSIGVGPYVGIVLTPNIVFSGNLLRTWIESEQAGGFLQFDTDRVQASAALNGYWYRDTWRFTPGATVSWSKDWEEESNGLFPDRTIEVGVFTPSFQIGNTLRLSDTATVEPWLGAAVDYTFLNDTDTSGVGTVSDLSTDLRLQAGLNFAFGSNAQLAITGEAAGLLLEDLDSYAIEANLAVQF